MSEKDQEREEWESGPPEDKDERLQGIRHLNEPAEKLEGICCVCGHKLANHIDEGKVWRCHSLGQDAYQCECALRKGRVIGDEPDTIEQYDLQKRINEKAQEKEGWG